jgi:hypothetical protein
LHLALAGDQEFAYGLATLDLLAAEGLFGLAPFFTRRNDAPRTAGTARSELA